MTHSGHDITHFCTVVPSIFRPENKQVASCDTLEIQYWHACISLLTKKRQNFDLCCESSVIKYWQMMTRDKMTQHAECNCIRLPA